MYRAGRDVDGLEERKLSRRDVKILRKYSLILEISLYYHFIYSLGKVEAVPPGTIYGVRW